LNKKIVLSLIAFSVIALAFVGNASAQVFNPITFTISKNLTTWQVGTDNLFSGKDVIASSVAAYYIDDAGNQVPLQIKHVVLTPTEIKVQFDAKDLPAAGSAVSTVVTGALKSGDTFLATGPGFTWVRHG
jgi:hypothetical protein